LALPFFFAVAYLSVVRADTSCPELYETTLWPSIFQATMQARKSKKKSKQKRRAKKKSKATLIMERAQEAIMDLSKHFSVFNHRYTVFTNYFFHPTVAACQRTSKGGAAYNRLQELISRSNECAGHGNWGEAYRISTEDSSASKSDNPPAKKKRRKKRNDQEAKVRKIFSPKSLPTEYKLDDDERVSCASQLSEVEQCRNSTQLR
jgi:hypothetical protein